MISGVISKTLVPHDLKNWAAAQEAVISRGQARRFISLHVLNRLVTASDWERVDLTTCKRCVTV